MPLLLQIGLVVKGIDCEAEPQQGLKRGETENQGVGFYWQVICMCFEKNKHVFPPVCKKLFCSTIYSNEQVAFIYLNERNQSCCSLANCLWEI